MIRPFQVSPVLPLAIALLAAIPTAVAVSSPAQAQAVRAGCVTACAETRFIEVEGVRYAYRVVGAGEGPPLLMLNRFRGTMDE